MTTRRALVVAPTLPEHDRQGGARDLADAVGFLRDDGWHVTYVACLEHAEPRHVRELRAAGVDVHLCPTGIPDEVSTGPAPDIVLIAFWHLAEEWMASIRRWWPTTRVIVSSIDLHFLRASRRIFGAVARGDRSFLLDGYFADDMIRELNTYAAADAVLCVSEKEASLIDDLTNERGLAAWVPVTQGEDLGPFSFEERRDVLFVGNFLHEPNVEAVDHLCRRIMPLIDPAALDGHCVRIVGNAPDDRVVELARRTPGVELVGWVPSLTPYLQQARVGIVPLLHGAGVKGKLVRALAAGTPTVSTTIGVEGLGLTPGLDVAVADDPAGFARSVERLLTDADAWSALSVAGHRHISSIHSPAAVRARLFGVIERVRHAEPKPLVLADQLHIARPATRYHELPRKLATVLPRVVHPGARVLVVSKGDAHLLDLGAIQAVHFPHDETDEYLGWHPPDVADVIRRLDEERARGPHTFVVPQPSLWWLDHYRGLREHLQAHYTVAVREEDAFVAWECGTAVPASVPAAAATIAVDDRSRPPIVASSRWRPGGATLVLGVYLPNVANLAPDLASVIAASRHPVQQRWIALGGPCPSPRLAPHTVDVVMERTPKFELMNRLLADEDLDRYEHVVIVDDDIVVPHGFLDEFLGWQQRLGYALAQPARTPGSYIDHRIVQQQRGVAARRTRFVEIGPVTSIHRSAFDLLLPFDLRSPMGWGYENVWSRVLDEAGLAMGIVDAVPIDHSLRPPVANYHWGDADRQRTLLLEAHPHRPLEECFRVLDIAPLGRPDELVAAH